MGGSHSVLLKFHAKIASGNLVLFLQKEIYLVLLNALRMITDATNFASNFNLPTDFENWDMHVEWQIASDIYT